MREAGPRSGWTAMVLAAGFGKRMLPITLTRPKPMVEVAGRALVDHALDRLVEAGIGTAIVNVHHLADQLERHLAGRQDIAIRISDERGAILETGGGVKKALPLLGDPFLVLNSDSLWAEDGAKNLDRLIAGFDPAHMDIRLMVAARETSLGYDGRGDFSFEDEGRLARRGARAEADYVYTGAAIMRRSLFAGTPEGAFSLNLVFDRALAAGRLHGMALEGAWLHVGTPEAIPAAEERLAALSG